MLSQADPACLLLHPQQCWNHSFLGGGWLGTPQTESFLVHVQRVHTRSHTTHMCRYHASPPHTQAHRAGGSKAVPECAAPRVHLWVFPGALPVLCSGIQSKARESGAEPHALWRMKVILQPCPPLGSPAAGRRPQDPVSHFSPSWERGRAEGTAFQLSATGWCLKLR